MAIDLAGYNGKVTPFAILSCMVASSGGLLFGYDLGISGGVTAMEPFLKKFFPEVYVRMMEGSPTSNYCKFNSQVLTAFTSSLYIAGLVATPFAILSCMVASSGGLLFGYDLGISGGVTAMEPFLKKFFPEVDVRMMEGSPTSNYCKFNSQVLTAFTSSLYIAGLVASLFASYVTRACGRRSSMLIGGAAFLADAAIGGAAFNVYMLILGRILLGVGIGFTNQSIPLYLSELAPPQYRGAINNGFEVCVSLGIFSANLINHGTHKIHGGWRWRVSLALAAIPASILTFGAFFLSETPNSIVQRNGDLQKAKHLLQKIRGTNEVQNELDDMIAASTISKAIQHPFRSIIQPKYRPQLVMATAIPFFQEVTGINVITFYSPVLFRTLGFKLRASLMSAVVARLVATFCNLISIMVVDRAGRRPLFIVGGVLMLISHTLVGGILLVQLGDHGSMSKGYACLVLGFVCTFVAGFALSWGPLAYLVPSEIFALEIRSAAQSIVVATGFLVTFIIAQIILAMLCHLKSGVFFFFGGWVVVMTSFVYILLPETKNVPIEQMNQIWRVHWFWKRIVEDGEKERSDNEAREETTYT